MSNIAVTFTTCCWLFMFLVIWCVLFGFFCNEVKRRHQGRRQNEDGIDLDVIRSPNSPVRFKLQMKQTLATTLRSLIRVMIKKWSNFFSCDNLNKGDGEIELY